MNNELYTIITWKQISEILNYSTFSFIKYDACIFFCFQKRRVQIIFNRIIDFKRFFNACCYIFVYNCLQCHKKLQKINFKIYTEHVLHCISYLISN